MDKARKENFNERPLQRQEGEDYDRHSRTLSLHSDTIKSLPLLIVIRD